MFDRNATYFVAKNLICVQEEEHDIRTSPGNETRDPGVGRDEWGAIEPRGLGRCSRGVGVGVVAGEVVSRLSLIEFNVTN